jgi:ribose-phosphate pyrophosphokinase
MIIIKNSGTGFTHQVRPTIFPDGTSQVWKLPVEDLRSSCRVTWHFEHEGELMHLLQLLDLCNCHGIDLDLVYIPYLPYGRQDKEVTNESTFALVSFLNALDSCICVDYATLDAHSSLSNNHAPWIESFSSARYIRRAIENSGANVIVYPDKGALARYGKAIPRRPSITEYVVLDKVRDQSTGQILSQIIDKSASRYETLAGKRLLIVDDICDGGWTFTSATKLLMETEPSIASIDLYVTHGIFSKGRQVLHDAGIRNIYTTKSLIKNTDGYDLEEF